MINSFQKIILLNIISFITSANVVIGQQLNFNGQIVDTIEITSSSGYYHFDDSGTTTSTVDCFMITFDKLSNKYIYNYKRDNKKYTCKPDSEETTVKFVEIGKIKEPGLLDSLLSALTVRYKKLSFNSIGLDTQDFYNLTNRKHLMIVAKKYKQDWQFKRRYSSKEDNKLIYKGCQNADTFNLFLNSYKVDTGGYIIVSDYSDEMYINIICGDKKYTYEGKYPNNFKQPWYDHSDTSWISYHSLFNFDINKWLVAILPEDFYRRETIEISSFTNSYIKWYLKRKQIIWDYF